MFISYLPTPSARAGYDARSIFKRSLTGLNPEFSFSYTSCLTKAEEPSLPYYLPTAGGRIIGFIPFPRVLVLCEMQSVSSRIWTRVAVSISYDDNHYTTGTSLLMCLYAHLIIITRDPTFIGTMVVLMGQFFFFNFYFQVFLFVYFIIRFNRYVILLWQWHISKKACCKDRTNKCVRMLHPFITPGK